MAWKVLPGCGGTSCGDPGPVKGGTGDGLSGLGMVVGRRAVYRPNALALSAS